MSFKIKQYFQSNEIIKEAIKISGDPAFYNIAGKNYQAMKIITKLKNIICNLFIQYLTVYIPTIYLSNYIRKSETKRKVKIRFYPVAERT